MTKKDYELIARVLSTTEASCLQSQWDAVWRDRDRVARAFAAKPHKPYATSSTRSRTSWTTNRQERC
jgi:hypothetical protein